jgi:outer membrane biosynthesis protein TonB
LTADDIEAIRELYSSTEPAEQPTPDAPADPKPETPATPPQPKPETPKPETPKQPQPKHKPNTPEAPKNDLVAPSLAITYPAATSFLTSESTIQLRGTAKDSGGIFEVTWNDTTGNSGIAQGTVNWITAPIPLRVGTNTITVRAKDAAGNAGWRSVSITRK